MGVLAEWLNAGLRYLFGGLAEWSIAPVLKTGGRDERPVGSNPTASAKYSNISLGSQKFKSFPGFLPGWQNVE